MKNLRSKQPSAVHILLIEDNSLDANRVKEFLAESAGFDFSLREAASMAAAEGYLAVEPFDVILLDLRLPDSVPLESYGRVEAAAGGTPVLVVTTRCEPDVCRELIRAGVPRPFLKGNMKGADLVAAIKTLAAGRN